MKKHTQPVRHFFTNLICGLVPNREKRNHLRVILNSDIGAYKKFIRQDLGVKKLKIRTAVGFRARNLIIIANDDFVYKFPLRNNASESVVSREKRVVDAFIDISPIYIPPVEILKYKDILVRKYEYIPGRNIDQIGAHDIRENADVWAAQIAKFLYVIGMSDPKSIRDLIPDNADTPHQDYGWYHGDIESNFMINPRTKNIIAIIDWEDCRYGDFSNIWNSRRPWRAEFMSRVRDQYLKLCGGK
ncbi:MAG: phosphotransferase [Muribaculaceae bacterium]|nr:phosphotransferase [Muribaculaceae bacterium]